ncbi:MAG: hypothetical protein IPI48_09645 [bacterium]|nr:hypothetical protein [bacterium]
MNDCIPAAELAPLAGLPDADPRRRHVEACARCRAAWLEYRDFMDGGAAGVPGMPASAFRFRRACGARPRHRGGLRPAASPQHAGPAPGGAVGRGRRGGDRFPGASRPARVHPTRAGRPARRRRARCAGPARGPLAAGRRH